MIKQELKETLVRHFTTLTNVAYTHSNQGLRVREFLLAFHNNRKVDIFGFVSLDRQLQLAVIYLLTCHIEQPHCIGDEFKAELENLSRFEDL